MSHCDALVVASSGREVWVEVSARAPACGQCKSPEACQGDLLGTKGTPRRYRLDNLIGARIGDRVQLTVADGTLWRAAMYSYGLPLVLAIAGAVLGQAVAGDTWAALGTLAGLYGGVILLRRKELRARRDASWFSLQVPTGGTRLEESS